MCARELLTKYPFFIFLGVCFSPVSAHAIVVFARLNADWWECHSRVRYSLQGFRRLWHRLYLRVFGHYGSFIILKYVNAFFHYHNHRLIMGTIPAIV